MLEVGKNVGGYILTGYIGSGGVGDVWKAERQTVLSTTQFALKFFKPKPGVGIDLEKVRKEVRVWKRVSGLPNVVSVIEADKFESYIYIVIEYVDGGSLESWLQRNRGKARSTEQ